MLYTNKREIAIWANVGSPGGSPLVAKPGWSKSPLRDDLPAQKTIISAQKRSLRDAFLPQNTILSAQKARAGRPSVIPKAKYMTLGPKF